jgi:hypothetical protein
VAFLLRNQRDPHINVILTHQAWLSVLDLAEAYGWKPFGTILPGHWPALEFSSGDYLPFAENYTDSGELVALDDALNLADALEEAFLAYEPRRLRGTTLLYAIEDPAVDLRPSIGAISAVFVLSRLGAFWIEPYRPDQ